MRGDTGEYQLARFSNPRDTDLARAEMVETLIMPWFEDQRQRTVVTQRSFGQGSMN
jgi:hypothetical protein